MRLVCKLPPKHPARLGILLRCVADPESPAYVPDATKAPVGHDETLHLPALLRRPASAPTTCQLLSIDLTSKDLMDGYIKSCAMVTFAMFARPPMLFTPQTIFGRWYGTLAILLITISCYKRLVYRTRRFKRLRRHLLGCLLCLFSEASIARVILG
ncbi:MAG: hypothetical protein KVP17_003678 [Porospora cf. gigantea B]|uniref:uncharacterized protein n=1 Tax=Porospora cf. gigantea B TaxID=2853592 RepID=UPI0035718677|nr:MAG: hypothetical protein KVP17_003678 [Porospora cf. gigantea B]